MESRIFSMRSPAWQVWRVLPRRLPAEGNWSFWNGRVLFLSVRNTEEERTTQSAYETPMGTLNIEVTTRELLVNLNEGRGQLKLAYDISVKGLFNHFNTISIELREDPDFLWKSGKS